MLLVERINTQFMKTINLFLSGTHFIHKNKIMKALIIYQLKAEEAIQDIRNPCSLQREELEQVIVNLQR